MSVIYNMDIKTDLHVQALGFHSNNRFRYCVVTVIQE